MTYYNFHKRVYTDKRSGKSITVPVGYISDGATGAIDVCPDGWWVHDVLCDTGKFDDGTPCNNWQASQILSDILKAEGFYIRTHTWRWMTWIFGGGLCRKNGMF